VALSLAALVACSHERMPAVVADDVAQQPFEDPGRDFPSVSELCSDKSLNPSARALTADEAARLEEIRFAYGVQMREVSRERGKVEREVVLQRIAKGDYEPLVAGEPLKHGAGVVSLFVATDPGGLPAVVKLRPEDLPGWERWTQLRETIQLEARAEFRNVFDGAL